MESFLNENQLAGKLSENNKMEIKSLEQAIHDLCNITNKEALEAYQKSTEDKWPTCTLSVYCHDCRKLVSPGIGETRRGKPRTICGVCKSKKISTGKEESLVHFYHLDKRPQSD